MISCCNKCRWLKTAVIGQSIFKSRAAQYSQITRQPPHLIWWMAYPPRISLTNPNHKCPCLRLTAHVQPQPFSRSITKHLGNMACCSVCEEWFHEGCEDFADIDFTEAVNWVCSNCKVGMAWMLHRHNTSQKAIYPT